MPHTDILYEKNDGVAWITIDRPEVRNAFRTRTVRELFGQAAPRVGSVDAGHGTGVLARVALNLYYQTDEAMEGRTAFVEKRPVDFRGFRT